MPETNPFYAFLLISIHLPEKPTAKKPGIQIYKRSPKLLQEVVVLRTFE